MSSKTNPRPQKTALLLAKRLVATINQRGKRVGDRLPPERILLEQYAVSRGTMREALRFLELQTVISLQPGPRGGPVVERPNASALATSLSLLLQFVDASFRSLAEARGGIEPATARLAAERMGERQLTDLKASVDRMAANLQNQAVFLEENKTFHELIAHGSGNAALGYLIDALLDIDGRSPIGAAYPKAQREAVCQAHRRIYDAIASGDPQAAAVAMGEHLDHDLRYAERRFAHALDAPITWAD